MRWLYLSLSLLIMLAGCETTGGYGPQAGQAGEKPVQGKYSRGEVSGAIENFFGVTAEAASEVVQSIFAKNGDPDGYITGTEGSAAIAIGLRYGEGDLWLKDGRKYKVYWQGPSIGWDFGGDVAKVFTLVYNLEYPRDIYQRFPGVEGSAYFIAGLGVNYQRAGGITLVPVRSGVGLRLGASVGYLSYSRQRNILPF